MTEEQIIEKTTPDEEPASDEQVAPVVSDEEPEPATESEVPAAEPEEATESETVVETDTIEPQTAVEQDAAEQGPDEDPPDKGPRVWWWPFIVYALSWVALIAVSYVLLTGTQAQMPAFRQEYYPHLLLAGLVLTLLGPLLAVAVWLVSWFKAGKGRRGGLFTRAILRGAVLTFVGVALWEGCLVLVDALRLGLV